MIPRRALLWLIVGGVASPANATITFCAVTEKTPDGFVSLRTGPAPTYPVIGKVAPADFLYVGTEECRDDFGKLLCSKGGAWLFVEQVVPFKRGSDVKKLKGWANGQLIRQIQCSTD